MLRFDSVTKKYSDKIALDRLTFDIVNYNNTALVGNNGCGKTTTINIICNLIKYDSGKVYLFDKLLTPYYNSYKNRIGVVLNTHYLISEFTLTEYWKFICRFQKVSPEIIKDRIEDLLQLFELHDERNKMIKKLSCGNQMKVSIGAALIHNPELIILDEPFVNLDVKTTEKLIVIIKGFEKRKKVFITSHHLDLVTHLCDSFLIMDAGRIIHKINKSVVENHQMIKEHIYHQLAGYKKKINLNWLQ
jgi:ABC-2 type transport system ATP-binding protein